MAEKKDTTDVEKEKKPRKLFSIRKAAKKKTEEKIQEIKNKKGDETDPFGILKFVLMTEKSIRMIEAENKMVFIVERKYSKNDIKTAFEKAFQSQVAAVKTQNDQKGRKRAFIKLKTPGAAGEIAIRLGII